MKSFRLKLQKSLNICTGLYYYRYIGLPVGTANEVIIDELTLRVGTLYLETKQIYDLPIRFDVIRPLNVFLHNH